MLTIETSTCLHLVQQILSAIFMWTFVNVYKDIQTMPRFIFSVLFCFSMFILFVCLFVFVHLAIDVELHLLVLLIDSEPINRVEQDSVLQCLRVHCWTRINRARILLIFFPLITHTHQLGCLGTQFCRESSFYTPRGSLGLTDTKGCDEKWPHQLGLGTIICRRS